MKSFTLKLIGKLVMLASFSLLTAFTTNAQCEYVIQLTDTWGDGWNGNQIHVYSDGVEVAGSPFTLTTGTGPEDFYFPVVVNGEITTLYDQIGGWPYENGYSIIDPYGNVVAGPFQGAYPNGPASIPAGSGPLADNCPPMGTIDGTVTHEDGTPSVGIPVGIEDITEVTTDGAGYYRLEFILTGTWPVYYYEDGINYIVKYVEVFENEVTTQDVVMAPPLMVVYPTLLQKTMNPGEWLQDFIGVENIGAGDLYFTTEIEWLEAAREGYIPPKPIANPAEISPNAQQVSDLGPEAMSFGMTDTPVATDAARDVGLACPYEDIVFDHMATSPYWANTSDEDLGWQVIQSFDADGAVGFFSFHFTFYPYQTGDIIEQIPFNIYVYEDDGGQPGDMVYAMEHYVDGYNTGANQGSYQNFLFSVELDEAIDLETGWVSAQASSNGPSSIFYSYWMVNTSGTHVAYQYLNGNLFNTLGTGVSCCLGLGGGGWLALSPEEGAVEANGGTMNVAAQFNAEGTMSGEVYNAIIHFIAQPDIMDIEVQASMIVNGEPLTGIEEFEAVLVDMAAGTVECSWAYPPEREVTFEHFLIRRNDLPVGVTTDLYFSDQLPEFGTYYYTVSAVFNEGESVPAGPEEVIWLIPEPCFMPDILDGETVRGYVWSGFEEQVYLTIENCGQGVLSFEFPGFEDPEFSQDFVTSVHPCMGQIAEGESMDVMLTYDATDGADGTYTTDLMLYTNAMDPNHEIMVPCEMIAYQPGIFTGVVTDCGNGAPIANATVTGNSILGEWYTETNAAGEFMLYVEPLFDPWGAYFVMIEKLGYETTTIFGLNTTFDGTPVELDPELTKLCETPYPVKWVEVDPNEEDTKATVTWSLPMGPYEIIYDDGTAENYFAWAHTLGAVAVKFTPAGYPATVNSARFYVGDGSYPVMGNFLGTQFAVGVLDDDGENGMPGTVLDSVVVDVNNYGWVESSMLGAQIDEGNFYIVMYQLLFAPDVAPIGIDEDMPTTFRSYWRISGGEWSMSPYQDFMIRATVSGPGPNVLASAPTTEGKMMIPQKPTGISHLAMHPAKGLSGTEKAGIFKPVPVEASDRDLKNYEVVFVYDFDPDMQIDPPTNGSTESRGTTTANQIVDSKWGNQDPGFYAYGVKAVYDNNESGWVFSDPAAHLLDNEVTVNVTQCDGEEPSGALVTINGLMFPYQSIGQVTPESGTVLFDSIIDGSYNLRAMKLGYQPYVHNNLNIYNDHVEDAMLLENTYAPRNLMVDPLTSVAMWDEPLYIQLPLEGFEEEPFPPDGWSLDETSPGSGYPGWQRTEDGSSGGFSVPSPPEEGGDWYAVNNDDQFYFKQQDDYLITPPLDLREATDYVANFLYYYDGAWGQPPMEFVYTVDAGATWEVLYETPTVFEWTGAEVDLSDLSGPDGLEQVWFAWHAYDNGGWLSGVALDNCYIGNGPVEIEGYHVWLDDGFVLETDSETTWYQYKGLRYGQNYTASVAALYGCNLSDRIYYSWTSSYLYPPVNLTHEYIYGTNEVPLFWNPPVTVAGPVMTSIRPHVPVGAIPEADGRSYLTQGEEPMRAPWTAADLKYDMARDEGLDIAIVTSAVGGANDFSEISAALIALGINSIEVVDIESTPRPTVEELLAYDGLLFGFNTFFTTPTGPVGDLLADYIDAGGNLTMTVPVFITGFTGTPIEGRLLDEGYYPVIPGSGPVGPANLGDFDPDHPIMEGVEDASGNLLANCGVDPDAETVAYWDMGMPLAAQKDKVIAVNVFIAASGYIGGDVDLILYNSLNTLQGGPGGPGAGEIPDGLAAFHVYRDYNHIGSQAYMGEEVGAIIEYVDNPVDPGSYMYSVTAEYDLTEYGFPGQTAESMHEGPMPLEVVWGYDLPFMETWDVPQFDWQGWRVNDPNWVIDDVEGNPAPAAKYNWDPNELNTEYSVSLTSAPMNADMMTEGDIWLDFEVLLNNRYATGDEKLSVEVYNGQEWSTVFEFNNGDELPWTFQHIQITNHALARVFQVRFNANGMNAFDVISWVVDNIYIYRTCEAPQALDGDYYWMDNEGDEAFGAEIWWEAPELPVPPEGWLYYHNGYGGYTFGTDAENWESTVAMYFEPGQLVDYPECAVTHMRVFVSDDPLAGRFMIAQVWEGEDAETLIYEEDVTDQILWDFDMNEVELSEPVPFDNTKDLWVGFTYGAEEGGFLVGISEELPAPERRGDLYWEDGIWKHMSDLGIGERVWMIEAFVTQNYEAPTALPAFVDDKKSKGTAAFSLSKPASEVEYSRVDRDFHGFNVYRKGPDDSDYLFLETVEYVEGQMEYTYYDEDPFGDAGYPYEACYQVTAMWESETDNCESPPAKAVIPIYDYVCIMVTGIDNPLTDGMTALYPNPATDRVNIASSVTFDRITIVNYIGQVVYDAEVNAENSVVINTSDYEAGMYIVRINTENGIVTKRMAISN